MVFVGGISMRNEGLRAGALGSGRNRGMCMHNEAAAVNLQLFPFGVVDDHTNQVSLY